MYTGLTFANRQFEEVGVFSFILSAMHSCMNGSVHDQSRVYLYSGAERSRKAFTRRGNPKGEETCQAYVESPARWGNAIPMESEKSRYKCQQVKAKCQQIKAKCQQIKAKCTRKSLSNTIKSLLSQLHVDTSILNMSKRASATVL